ncbi:ABC transporter permease [Myxococcota bacterium]|nr:ABC transporter permease [Myxococcota bacterium]MBU1431241.1 ABC transporter permease [Myxococcota bacterium]MBU1898070.1 ABC transporter permease [Myxococcota bacterium]
MKPALARHRAALIRIGAMAHKELAHIRRDPQMLAFALLLPLLLLLLFGYAISFDVDHIPLAVVDRDQSPASRALIQSFTTGDLFVEVARSTDVAAMEPHLRRGEARAVLVIDEGYARRQARGEPSAAQLLLDGADNSTASVALGYATALASPPPPGLPVTLRPRALFNPGLRSAVFILPGLIVFLLVMIAVMLTALTVAREFERGSMEQLFATPIQRLEIILGKLLPYFGLGLLQVLLVLTAGVTLFDLPVRGALPTVGVITSLFLLANLAQGLVISVITRNQMIASQAAVLTTLLPALLLSGFVFPIDNMPIFLQIVARIFPASHLVDALRAVLLRGNGFEALWGDLAAIGGFFLVMLGVATRRFQREVR